LMLMKKHDAINYHAVREAVAAGIFWESERRTAKQIWQMYWQRWLWDKRDEYFCFHLCCWTARPGNSSQGFSLMGRLHCRVNLQGLTKELVAL
jgi:hypothetical protein